MKIEKYYKIHFLRIVAIPFVAILIIVMSWLNYINTKDRREGLKISAESVRDVLSEEISDYSTRFSYFMSSNDKEVLDNITMHDRGNRYQKYIYDKQLLHWYNLNVIQISPFETIDFYLTSGNKYSFEENKILDKNDIESCDWYKHSIDNPDKICIHIINTKNSLSNYKNIEDDELIVASMSMKDFAKGTDVEMGVLTAKSKALAMIRNPKSLTYDYEMYLIDSKGGVLCNTESLINDNDECETIDSMKENWNYNMDYYEVIEPRTKWRIISVVDKREYSKNYITAIYMISLGMLLLFLILYFSVKKLFVKIIDPINNLSSTMENIKDTGELKKVEIDGFDEIRIIKETYNGMINKIDYLIKENEEKEREKNKEQMKALERQLNPHFLSNTIGNIRFIAMVSRFESIQKMTEALICILDSSFRNNSSFHTLEEEIKILDSYVYLMKIRYANSFDIQYILSENIKSAIVPKLILQPFVENSITHGFNDKDIFGRISIYVGLEEKELRFEIVDNGKGIEKEVIDTIMSDEIKAQSKHIGINNIAKRIRLYYGSECKIEIISEPKIKTTIKFNIPYYT